MSYIWKFLTVLYLLIHSTLAQQYQPNWSSLDSRPLPIWYDQAKFGVQAHWGVYSVPAYGDESFWFNWKELNDSNLANFVQTHYKPGTTYGDFAKQFNALDFDANYFAGLIKGSGAKYFILTAKHSDGFALWPSAVEWNWDSMDVGPAKDLLGEIRQAINASGLHFGAYFSLLEWFHPLMIDDQKNGTQDYVNNILYPQLIDLVSNYQPEILWADGVSIPSRNFQPNSSYWRSTEFLAWLYNQSPVKDTVVTNDRWGSDTSCAHGGFYTCQSQPTTLPTHKWENVVSADKSSRGYRRTMKLDDIYSSDELIAQLAQTISLGGNFVLNIAIDANGRVLPVFEERLKNLGDFVTDHSDAIFSSKPWIYQSDVDSVVYTSQLKNSNNLDPYRLYNPQQQNNTVIYAFVTNWPDDNLVNLTRVVPTSQTTVNLLHAGPGTYSSVPFSQTSNGILVDISNVSLSNFPSSNYVVFDTFVLKIENAADQCPVNWIQNSINQQECLTFGNSTLGWNAANSQCGTLGPGATLTSINSVFENSVIQDINQGCSNAYIGLYRNSSSSNWQWINGDTSTYTNWGPGYPTNDPNSNCVIINENGGKWANQNCATLSCFICKLKN